MTAIIAFFYILTNRNVCISSTFCDSGFITYSSINNAFELDLMFARAVFSFGYSDSNN